MWLRIASQASDALCRIAAQAPGKPWRRIEIQAFENEPRWMALHASDRERCGITHAAPLATSNAPAAAKAMGRKARRLRKLGRSAVITPGRFGDTRLRCAGAAAGVACACGPGSDARTELHGPQRPWSPPVGEYSAPQLMHPVTEAGLLMLARVPDRSGRIPCVTVGCRRTPGHRHASFRNQREPWGPPHRPGAAPSAPGWLGTDLVQVVRGASRRVRPSCRIHWWSMTGSNRRPPQCHCGALPAELMPRALRAASVGPPARRSDVP